MRESEENATVKGESSDDDGEEEEVQYRAPGLPRQDPTGGEKVERGDRGAGDDVEVGGERLRKGERGGRRYEYRGGDYYEFIARSPSIR